MRSAIVTTAAVICVLAGCGGSGAKLAARSTTTTTTAPCLGCIDVSTRVADVRLARSSNGLFSIFPASPGITRCAIPSGGPAGLHLEGRCETTVVTTHAKVVVSFTETWVSGPRCPPGDHCPPNIGRKHTWSVVERAPRTHAPLRVVATHQSGNAGPPQLWD